MVKQQAIRLFWAIFFTFFSLIGMIDGSGFIWNFIDGFGATLFWYKFVSNFPEEPKNNL